jgi:hypothetical protein
MRTHRATSPPRTSLSGIRLACLLALGATWCQGAGTATADTLPLIETVEAQPLLAQVQRLTQTLDDLGSPLSAETRAALERATQETDDQRAVLAVQEALDPLCLLGVRIDPPTRMTLSAGPARPELVEGGWRQFLVKVHNAASWKVELRMISPSADSLFNAPAAEIENRWLELQMFNKQPFQTQLGGLEVEYRILQVYSRVAGRREATLAISVARSETVSLLFDALPSQEITLRVRDENGQPTTAAFIIRDQAGRFYPSQVKRLAPDFAFHPQVYRADGEKLKLPAGAYTIEYSRGPEYLSRTQSVFLDGSPQTLAFNLERWVDPAKLGWWSGDHHIHAAGCSHFVNPTQGVHPADMIRHCLGEDLKVGCTLTWGPGFDYQKQFFSGAVDGVSQFPYLLRYDIEVSGFGSHRSGHLCLLRLKEQHYPGGDSTAHWPTLCLNTLRWAKQQGAVCGPAHSGKGLEVRATELPNYVIPPFNDIGAMEYIVDVTHEVPGPDGRLVPALDFLSVADTPYVWELNIWYHTLNCGFRPRISGESDFPCIYDERVGVGRSYVKLDGSLDFDQWCEGIRQGRSYAGDGRSHLMEFRVSPQPLGGTEGGFQVAVGENGSELRLPQPGMVHLSAKVAALLSETPDPAIRKLRYTVEPFWHLERSRVGDTREVPVEVVVNGYPVARQSILADGTLRDLTFEVPIERSSWVALRILPSSHTNPVFVLVGDRPIRASRRSADWCLKSVDKCWSQKQRFIHATEMEDAIKAYDHARATYRRILEEAEVD